MNQNKKFSILLCLGSSLYFIFLKNISFKKIQVILGIF